MRSKLLLSIAALVMGTSFNSLYAEDAASEASNLYYTTFIIQSGDTVFTLPNLEAVEGATAVIEQNTTFGSIKMDVTPRANGDQIGVQWNMTLSDLEGDKNYKSSTNVVADYHQAINLTDIAPIKADKPFSDVSVMMQVTPYLN